MKPPKTRCTAAQLDQAIVEEVEYLATQIVSKNLLSSVMMFAVLVSNRLFGERKPDVRSQAFRDCLQRVMLDAKAERAEAEIMERKRQLASENRIVVPGGPSRDPRLN